MPRLRATDREPFRPHPLTGEEVAAVAATVAERAPIYGLVILFLAYSGLRAAELAGLEIRDVRGNAIRVERTKRKVRGGWETGTPKSRKSRRVVPLDDWLADDLRAYLATHPRRTESDAPLFPARYGRNAPGVSRAAATDPDTYNWSQPVDPGTLYASYFRPAAPGVRLHDLRHSYAVLSLSAGAHYMAVSKWLGHESFVTTLTIYADYIDTTDGGKAVPLARPTAQDRGTVLPFRPRRSG